MPCCTHPQQQQSLKLQLNNKDNFFNPLPDNQLIMDSVKEAVNKAGENIRQGVDSVKENLQVAGHKTQEHTDMNTRGNAASTHTPGNVASEKIDQAKHSLGQTGEQLKHRTQEAARDVKHS